MKHAAGMAAVLAAGVAALFLFRQKPAAAPAAQPGMLDRALSLGETVAQGVGDFLGESWNMITVGSPTYDQKTIPPDARTDAAYRWQVALDWAGGYPDPLLMYAAGGVPYGPLPASSVYSPQFDVW
jgi:hypothetical protein